MSVTLGQLLTSTYRRMGTKPGDPEYPRDQMTLYVNLALGELHSDCAKLAGGDILLELGRAITKTGDRQWAFAQQSPAITSVLQVRRVRIPGQDTPLVSGAAESLEHGAADYALTGPNSAIVLRASTALNAQTALSIDFTQGPPILVADADTMPAWLDDQYRDVVELMAADAGVSQGAEGKLSPRQLERLEDRRAQLWTHWSSRTPGPSQRRD